MIEHMSLAQRLLPALLLPLATPSYVPPYYEGVPALDPPDFRGTPVYRVEFSLSVQAAGMPEQGFVHRSWEDFRKFDRLLLTHLVHPLGLSLPSEPSVASLDSYLTACLQHNNIVHSNVLHDFLGINWSGRDLLFLQSLPEFMKVVIPPRAAGVHQRRGRHHHRGDALRGLRLPDGLPFPIQPPGVSWLLQDFPRHVPWVWRVGGQQRRAANRAHRHNRGLPHPTPLQQDIRPLPTWRP